MSPLAKNRISLYKIAFSFALIGMLFAGMLNMVFAHGYGVSIEETVDGYLVDIGLSDEQFVAGNLARFDFVLIDEETGEEVPFTDVWFRINQDRKVFLATGIHRPELGQTGVSYTFPSSGEYQVSVRYQMDGETLAEHTFPLTVAAGPSEGTALSNKAVLGSILGAGVLALVLGFFVGKKSAV